MEKRFICFQLIINKILLLKLLLLLDSCKIKSHKETVNEIAISLKTFNFFYN